MQRIIAWWVHNPVAANLLMVGILLSGFLGLQMIEKEAFPQIKIKVGVIGCGGVFLSIILRGGYTAFYCPGDLIIRFTDKQLIRNFLTVSGP